MIYFADVTGFQTDDPKWEPFLSDSRKKRLTMLKQPDDCKRALAVELLLCFALKIEFPHLSLPANYHYDAKGKPILDEESVYISLSHSGRYVACAISQHPIGIDIQWQKETSTKVIEKVLTKNQRDMIATMPPKKQNDAYYDFWCLKESYFKLTGEGSIRQPIEFEFSNLGGRLGITKGELNLQNYSTVPGYSLGVCVDGPLPHCIFQVSAQKMEEVLLQK
jgi:4'-phosphopantetheinyl transferase